MADVRKDADRVLKITAELRDLRGRLAELDSERTAVERKIQQKLAEIGLPPEHAGAERGGRSDQILAHMRLHPGKVFTAPEIAREWNVTSALEIGNFRVALRRLSKARKIERIGQGRYRTRPNSTTVSK